ncbi:hypothetical protein FQR65_LT08701 [Abscondita terminalis]|nr:hypothetical protein FQR65_LT08701 [Abscondita terminalis]
MLKKLFAVLVLLKEAIGLKPFVKQQMELNSCVVHTINNIFNENNSILFVSEVGEEFGFLDEFTNPYAIANTYGVQRPEAITNLFLNNHNVVAHFVHMKELSKFIYFWNVFYRAQSKSTILFIRYFVDLGDIGGIFIYLWRYNFYNVVVIGYDHNFIPTLYYSDQFAIKNYCGKKFEDYIIGDCNSTKKYQFPPVIRRYPNCQLFDARPQINHFYNVLNLYNSTRSLLQIIRFMLNVTENFPPTSYLTVILGYFGDDYQAGAFTIPFYYDDVIWSVPIPNLIPPPIVLKVVFKPTLWLLVILALIFTSIAWWLVAKIFKQNTWNNLHGTIFDVFSITMLGSSNNVPVKWALRYAFLGYVIYAIHIQTAFTSNLTQILTTPQYEPYVKNLEDLAHSNLPIFAVDRMKICGSSKYAFFGYGATISLWPAFQASLAILTETGIVNYRNSILKNFNNQHLRVIEDGYVDMTIEHACSIFAIWGLGLFLAFVVFLLELLFLKINK